MREQLVGQARVLAEIRARVSEWRGFELGLAREPYPDVPPRYEPVREGERAITPVTRALLTHWFRREPHFIGPRDAEVPFKYWPHQRRAVETFIYLYEVLGLRRTEALWAAMGVEPLGPQRDPWAKLGAQLATGSGKTKVMSLLVTWAHLNALCEPDSGLGFGRHLLIIAPGLFVRDRLLQDFAPAKGLSVFQTDPVVPPDYERIFSLDVYDPVTCPLALDPRAPALVVTNRHQLEREGEAPEIYPSRAAKNLDLLFGGKEPKKLEDTSTPLLSRFARSEGLLVINDEAHGVGDEPEHVRFEEKAKAKNELGVETSESMSWIRSLRRLNGERGRLALQLDLSATLYEEQGGVRKAGKGKKGQPKERTEFAPNDLFRHAALRYDLPEAIRDGIVKRPILERLEVTDAKTGEEKQKINQGAPNAWEKNKFLVQTGIERWKKVRDQLRDEGDARKPILFFICEDRTEAKEIANFLSYGEAVAEDLAGKTPVGFRDREGETLFLAAGADGVLRSTVLEVHIGAKEEANEADWEKVRARVNQVDRERIPDPSGATDADGTPVLIDNPVNVVVSVMMLREGWDVRNVKVIVPLRPCDSRTLTEQVLGRGLRRMHAPELDEDGGARLDPEELYVIEHPSFDAVLDQIGDLVDVKDGKDIQHGRDYVGILQVADDEERRKREVRLVSLSGLHEVVADWRTAFEVKKLPALAPRLPWHEDLSDVQIETWLKKALAAAEEEGQTFTIPAEPSFKDFDQIIERAYARPLLRERLRLGDQHRTAVKSVVKAFLETKTFAIPGGLPVSFDREMEPAEARVALSNLGNPAVIEKVVNALHVPLRDAISRERRAAKALLQVRKGSDIPNHQALRRHLSPPLARSPFQLAAMDSADELRVALMLDRCTDVTGWLFNHQRGVGYVIEYDWQGFKSRYFPDFIARAREGQVHHNFIIEVKGRLDDRDKAKARAGRRFCELLSQLDEEPWHYLLLLENKPVGREDITWWGGRTSRSLFDLLRRHEELELYPEGAGAAPGLEILDDVPRKDRYERAVPVYDLLAAAGAFSAEQEPIVTGWARFPTQRPLGPSDFVARVQGRSMEDRVPDGSMCLFRLFKDGAPDLRALDGRRLLVQLRTGGEPELGGRYTVKRWTISRRDAEGYADEVELRPDNRAFPSLKVRADDGDLRPLAELIEVVG